MKVTVDEDWCVGSGSCVMASPEVFDQDDDGMVVLLQEEPGPELGEAVARAAAVCPAKVIAIQGETA